MDQGTGNIILTGFSYTGKSVVGREIAKRLGWGFIDTDDEIVRLAGRPIPDIFAQEGEERFRQLERQVLQEACQREMVVIATGGGAVLDSCNREAMAMSGVVICLEASSETIHRRLLADAQASPNAAVRPLLTSPDPLTRIQALKESRQPYYAMADWTVHTDALGLDEVCWEVLRGWHYGQRRLAASHTPIGSSQHETKTHRQTGAACVVTTATESYPVFADWGSLSRLGQHLHQMGLGSSASIISDEAVFAHYGQPVEAALAEAGFKVASFAVPPGEASKTLDTAASIYDWLVDRRAERGEIMVALGGGMVCDLAGFVAATFLRGLPLVHAPTSLLAMVDAAIGGKVAVNHPQGKNLIGAFYQPRLVLMDVATLKTLPRRELISGWAEVIKHGLILDPALFSFLEENAEALLRLEEKPTTKAVLESVRLKAGVVSVDEKETGRRIILNYGHTIAHGIEAASGYSYLHGEAVAIGMMGAALLSQRLGLLSEEVIARQRALLERFGLPTRCSGISAQKVLRAMELDKKVRTKAMRWVLLKGMGQVVVRDDVPRSRIAKVVEEVIVEGNAAQ